MLISKSLFKCRANSINFAVLLINNTNWTCNEIQFLFLNVLLLLLLNSFSQVNGRNILSVDYDRTLRTERIYDDHRKFLLKIGYDPAGQPALWMPSSKLLPVNLTRRSNGQLSTIQWGAVSERLEHDEQGRVHSRVFPDGKIWSYTYLEKVRCHHRPDLNVNQAFPHPHAGSSAKGRLTIWYPDF